MTIRFKNGSSIETLDETPNIRSSRAERQLGQFYSYFPHLVLLNLIGIRLKWYQILFVKMQYLFDRSFRKQVKYERKLYQTIEQQIKVK